MSDGFQGQVSLKFGPQMQHLINVRGDSIQELAQNCEQVEQIVPALKELGELFAGPTEGQAIGEIQTQLGGQVVGQTCSHGVMVYKTGTGRNGKPWKAWMCQGPQGNQCNPVWV